MLKIYLCILNAWDALIRSEKKIKNSPPPPTGVLLFSKVENPIAYKAASE